MIKLVYKIQKGEEALLFEPNKHKLPVYKPTISIKNCLIKSGCKHLLKNKGIEPVF